MIIREFIALLSRYCSMSLQDFESLDHIVDIYDFRKRPQDYLKPTLCEELKSKTDWFEQLFDEYELAVKKDIQILYPGHSHYPSEFLCLEHPPLCLMVMGNVKAIRSDRISVVGSRFASRRVLDWMDQHLSELVQKSCTLISGAARGIDQRAHLISLKYKKPTIAFLPSGLLQIYPSEFSSWVPKILEAEGVVISEYSLNQTIRPYHFHERNRMIAKLGYFLLVCEARRKSGSIMTARLAIENSKTVCVLPSFPTETCNQGGSDLLFQGAFPVRDFEDLLGLFECEKAKSAIPDHF